MIIVVVVVVVVVVMMMTILIMKRLASLAADARQTGNNFFYFAEGGSALREHAQKLDGFVKQEEGEDEELKAYRDAHPDEALVSFFERLEEMQQRL